jgi:predicted nucleic acid-binding protein
MNVVDSSAWLEYFSNSKYAKNFAKAIESTETLLVPTISIFEVFKKVTKERGEDLALQAVALMQQGRVVALDVSISLTASKISLELNIPMADSIILATARLHKATLWTQDSDFCGLDGVRYFKK